jgi:hypothetical protein
MPIHKKNILIPAVLGVLAWVGVVATIFVLKPEGIATILFFFSLLFIAIYLSVVIPFSNKRRALLVASLVVSLLLVRYFHLDSIINFVLLVGIFATIEVYFISQKSQKQ